ncbi:hypothetical protein LCGC14_1892880 [marine sediment metagenome]|uniref:Uncharacterized protein n=1 Tax=marine sediment metagenome TaxID=412755 RepID=A0A0F9FZ70_9ZZZZ
MTLRVFVEVSDKYLWTLKPFSYLFNVYWSTLQPVVIGGYKKPDFSLPDNFEFYQIDEENYPAKKWSDGMLRFFRAYNDDHFVFMLSDYWLCRTVDIRGVAACHDYIVERPEVLRIDLTDDRLYAGGRKDIGAWGCYDMIETESDTPYQMSTQAAIWSRKLFLSLLIPGKSPWEVELHTRPPESMRVLGTRQMPVRYANALLKGSVDWHQLRRIPTEHLNHIKDNEWLPE